MPTLTLWRPWAALIVHGYKTVEYRSHDKYRWLVGKIMAIHSGRKLDPEIGTIRAEQYNVDWKKLPDYAGLIVGTAQVVECEPVVGGYAYRLEKIKRLLRPMPARGSQGVWSWIMPEGLEFTAVDVVASVT
jgi:hypothetical protein